MGSEMCIRDRRQSKPNGTDVDEDEEGNGNTNDDADAKASIDPSEADTRETAEKE